MTDAESDRRAGELFLALLDAPPEQHELLLTQRCAGLPELRARVERLLAARRELGDFLEAPVALSALRMAAAESGGDRPGMPPPADRSPAADPLVGCHIGRYEVLRLLGAGGMGCVYEARQEQPRRSVALKVVRSGFASEQLLRRFEREADTLGQLHHPGIAQIYEAGVGEIECPAAQVRDLRQRVPFFAMELIDGRPIDCYVRERGLTVRQRFELFADVCDAVHHAHERGVIHRDLKPANILVDEFGQPKVVDFGVARLTDADVQATTLQTDAGQIIGTLAYMSPEQVLARPEELDVRSDVYTLGVVLYELVAGRSPYRVAGHTIPEAARIIREEEPSRLSSIDSRWRGDVETIVARALEKDKTRRYASPAELAADLRRYLADEPIVARPPGTFYQLRKFARRHRALVAGTIGTLLALTAGVIVATSYAVAEFQQRRIAQAKTIEAGRLAYVASVAAATAALEQGDLERAQQNLARAPAALRGWEWEHLNWASNRSIVTLATDVGAIPWPIVSADGATMVSAPADGLIRVWDLTLNGGAPTAVLRTRFQALLELDVYGTCVSADGSLLYLTGTHGGISVWDIAVPRGTAPAAPLWHRDAPKSRGSISLDGTLVAHSNRRAAVVLYDARSGDVLRTIRLQGMAEGSPYSMHFKGDGRLLCADDQIVELSTGALVGSARREYGRYLSGDWSRVAVVDPGIRVYSTATGEELASFDVVDPRWQLTTVGWSSDGHVLYVPRGKGFVEVMDARLSRIVTLRIPRGFIRALGGRSVIVTTPGHTLELWDMFTAGSFTLPTLPNLPTRAAAVASDARSIAIGGWGHVRMYNAATGELLWNTRVGRTILATVAVSADGRRVAAGDAAGGLRMLDASDGRVVGELDAAEVARALLWLPAGVADGAASRGLQSRATGLLAGGSNGALKLYDADRLPAGGWVIGRHDSPVNALALSPDARLAASGSGDGLELTEIGTHSSGRADNTIRLWRSDTWECVRVMRCESTVMALAFSPNGRRLAAALSDGAVMIYPTHPAEAPIVWRRGGPTRALAYHPSGKRLVACGQGAIRVWDCLRSEEVAVLPTQPADFFAAGFTVDGRTLVASALGTAVLRLESGPAEVDPLARFHLAWGYARLAREGRGMQADVEEALARDEQLPQDVRQAALRTLRTAGDHAGYLVSDATLEIRRRQEDSALLTMAARRLARARKLLPADPSAAQLQALALYYLGRHEEALAAADAAIQIATAANEPPGAGAMLLRALCRQALGKSGSEAAFAQARRLAGEQRPLDAETRELLEHASHGDVAPD